MSVCGQSRHLCGSIARFILTAVFLGIPVFGGSWPSAPIASAPSAWAGEADIGGEPAQDLGLAITNSLQVARNCPASFLDGVPDVPDINIRSCHTTPVTCEAEELPLNCGKRALMAQDWETALKAFERAALAHGDDLGEAIYGRYLARLFRVYADFNNLFFEDAFGAGFNQTHLTRDLHDPGSSQGRAALGHVACLAKPVYRYGDLFFNTSLIDIDLQRIVDDR
jgi:hypothetical protein